VARNPSCVKVEGGRILQAMERGGLSFARFVRSLRMGLGDRHDDPRVREALSLFRKGFRKRSLRELLPVAERLRDIFGQEATLLESVGQDASLLPGESELAAHGEDITDEELQEAIREALRSPQRKETEHDGRGPAIPWINLNEEETFRPITTVIPVPFDPGLHSTYVAQVARHARQLRRYLESLGLSPVRQRFRIQGRAVDRSRLHAAVLRGDPRILIARRLRPAADLFLGLVIDCSGSMEHGDSMQRAKLFGTLLAEGARGLRGIEVRIFGFTDNVIFDAGTAQRCAVHSLKPEGGNNDAAALWHAAKVSLASRRRSRLLVMISDGLPTQCSAAALKSLVQRLGRRLRICCAQVAVRPLEVICFPHYVELKSDEDLSVSVRRFGEVITRLVRRTVTTG
jgi:hypothetical protein